MALELVGWISRDLCEATCGFDCCCSARSLTLPLCGVPTYLEGGLGGCVGEGGGHMGGRSLEGHLASWAGQGGFRGEAPHVLLEGAVVPEGVMALGGQPVVG